MPKLYEADYIAYGEDDWYVNQWIPVQNVIPDGFDFDAEGVGDILARLVFGLGECVFHEYSLDSFSNEEFDCYFSFLHPDSEVPFGFKYVWI
jgi:hypothetical protein